MASSSVCKLQRSDNMDDWISRLPDEILADILSMVTLKEAGRSSVLSKRWCGLWKSTSRLNFDAPGALHTLKITSSKYILKNERSKYLNWVNDVLRSHERSTIDEFRVHFTLEASHSAEIDEWVKFFIQKEAKNVEIDLTPYVGDKSYTLSPECYQYFKIVSNLSNIANLRSLLLGQVNVDGELVEYLLSKCPNLEKLSISWSNLLASLRVDDPSLVLKYLEIRNCSSLERIELSAPKLETFIYIGHVVDILLGRHPLLTELSIGGESGRENVVPSCFGIFESYFSQLESLTLTMSIKIAPFVDGEDIPLVSDLPNLKYLKLVIQSTSEFCSLIVFTRFIAAAPSLSMLSIELDVRRNYPLRAEAPVPFKWLGSYRPLMKPHNCLKEVEIFGYVVGQVGFDFAWYLMKTATNLKKMAIDTRNRDGSKSKFRRDIEEQKKQLVLDKYALMEVLPTGAELIVQKLYS